MINKGIRYSFHLIKKKYLTKIRGRIAALLYKGIDKSCQIEDGVKFILQKNTNFDIKKNTVLYQQVRFEAYQVNENPASITIQENSRIKKRAWLLAKSGSISLGINSNIGHDSELLADQASISIGSGVRIAAEVVIMTADHTFTDPDTPVSDQPFKYQDVIIEDNAWVGRRVIVLPGVTIGKSSIIASGSIVTKNVAPYDIVGGIPAKKIKSRLE